MKVKVKYKSGLCKDPSRMIGDHKACRKSRWRRRHNRMFERFAKDIDGVCGFKYVPTGWKKKLKERKRHVKK